MYELNTLETKEEFSSLVTEIESRKGYRRPLAWGIGKIIRGQLNADKTLAVTFPFINWNCNFESFAVLYNALNVSANGSELIAPIGHDNMPALISAFYPYFEEAVDDKHLNAQVIKLLSSQLHQMELPLIAYGDYSLVAIYEDTEVKTTEAAYLKLMAISQGLVPLRSLNLNGVFGSLTNCAWVGTYPVELEYLRKNELQLKLTGEWPKIDYVDKFPRYLDHVIPADNTRILETSKVRFGAQLAAGTVVMPGASYVNFNSGTEGVVMVEGRISSTAKVGDGSDIGGGASILGTLSGGNKEPITIGKNTLLGANSVCGISLGDSCILDAGCTILAGTRVTMLKTEFEKIQQVNEDNINVIGHPDDMLNYSFKGKMLSGLNGLHIRQDSETGRMTAFRSVRTIELNSDLH